MSRTKKYRLDEDEEMKELLEEYCNLRSWWDIHYANYLSTKNAKKKGNKNNEKKFS